jgi:hypothetical protein
MDELQAHSITYRIAVGPRAGRKVFTLQRLPACDPGDRGGDSPGKAAGFSLHAGAAAWADERKKLVGGTLAVPVNARSSVKRCVCSGVSSRTGNGFDLIGIAWEYRWGGGL